MNTTSFNVILPAREYAANNGGKKEQLMECTEQRLHELWMKE